MKRLLVGALLSVMAMAGATSAGAVQVDFSGLGINAVDITSEHGSPPLVLNGVSIFYDNFGSAPDFAYADGNGVFGTTFGPLILNFSAPVVTLTLNFSVLNTSGPDQNSLTAFSDNPNIPTATVPGTWTQFSFNPTVGQTDGSLIYHGTPFTMVTLYFSPYSLDPNNPPDGQNASDPNNSIYFSVDNISYLFGSGTASDFTTTPIPLPYPCSPLASALWVCLAGAGSGRTLLHRSLTKTPDRISERPPRGGLSFCGASIPFRIVSVSPPPA